ncbi:MAG: peptidoglycan editing factor PgeF [Bacteroides sp.]|nr:peptidoglycan editing factor PgeF [Bacteroides sp.]
MRDPLTSKIQMLEYGMMKPYSNISCFSTTRHGGCGEGAYATFNCTHYCGDTPENVSTNLERLATLLPKRPHVFVIPRQTHTTNVRVITEMPSPEELQEVDAVVTHLKDYCLCVSTADCVPVLLYDKERQVIAAVHAGWRGTVGRIVEKTLQTMKTCYGTGGKDVLACIGPSISLESFEVGDEVYAAFAEAGLEMDRIARRYEKWHLDLWEANRLQLLAHDVLPEHIEVAGICTYQNHEDFFSARRLGIKSGRILSGIQICHSEERSDEYEL